MDELRAMATAKGWGLIDIHSAFKNDSRGLAAIVSSDGLHPNADGYDLGGAVAARGLGVV
ncbi:SGNH/GDSL hydrolase family protein [Rhodococcus opacus]|nr:SGNH/GDSL hydrolase family protein [Rhodococcus opacus]